MKKGSTKDISPFFDSIGPPLTKVGEHPDVSHWFRLGHHRVGVLKAREGWILPERVKATLCCCWIFGVQTKQDGVFIWLAILRYTERMSSEQASPCGV